ncbi:MAG: hypothetical protein GX825_09505, partial [Syntrophomonadaceae bacterium]|nr:hypothetical protein [Syntrophomonadaceae bacterium]
MYRLTGIKERYSCSDKISNLGNMLVDKPSMISIIRRVMLGTRVSGLSDPAREKLIESSVKEAEIMGDIESSEVQSFINKLTEFLDYDLKTDCR